MAPFFVKFSKDDAFLPVGAAHAVEFLAHGLAEVEVDAVALAPLVDVGVELAAGMYLGSAGAPEIEAEEVVDGGHEGTAAAAAHVVVELAGLLAAVGDADADSGQVFGAAAGGGWLDTVADVAEDEAVLVALGREGHGVAQAVDEPLAQVLFHL